MTLDSLQRIVLSLSNQCHVRWWAHYNYPQHPPKLALSCHQADGAPAEVYADDLIRRGLVEQAPGLWLADRTDPAVETFPLETD